jgi:hypothetical protein
MLPTNEKCTYYPGDQHIVLNDHRTSGAITRRETNEDLSGHNLSPKYRGIE